MHWRLFLMPELLHLMPMPSDALMIVWLPGCCTQPWNGQMHAGGCLLRKSVAVRWLQRHSRWCRRFCIRCWNRRMHWRLSVDAGGASDACWSCRLADWLQNKLLTRSKCRLVAFDRFISLTWLLNLIKRNELTRMKRFSETVWCFFHWEYRFTNWFRFRKIVNNSWIAELFASSSFCRNQMKNIILLWKPDQQCLWTAVRTLNAHVLSRSKQLVFTQRFWRLMFFSPKI